MSGGGFTARVRRQIVDRQDGACAIGHELLIDTLDGTTLRPHHFHHRLPRRAGGRFGVMARVVGSAANGLLVCPLHHDHVERDWPHAYVLSRGWVIPEGGALPADVPVFHLGEWVFLAVDGSFSLQGVSS